MSKTQTNILLLFTAIVGRLALLLGLLLLDRGIYLGAMLAPTYPNRWRIRFRSRAPTPPPLTLPTRSSSFGLSGPYGTSCGRAYAFPCFSNAALEMIENN